MADARTYLNVPYAQKDEAKALGARWDPAQKKWYVPAGKDFSLFTKWHMDPESTVNLLTSNTRPPSTTNKTNGVFTHPSIENFEPYSGDQPPWDC